MTNIHAEMASVVMATMSDDPEVVALALIRDGAKSDLPRPCGVCRQFLHEHSLRTGRDIVVIMGSLDGLDVECEPMSSLLPKSWFAQSVSSQAQELRWNTIPPYRVGAPKLEFGDQVLTEGRYLSIVWAPEWEPGKALLKLKYDGLKPAPPGGRVFKFHHSFSEYPLYLEDVRDKALAHPLPWGDPAYLAPHGQIEGHLQRTPIECVDLMRQPVDPGRLRPLLDILLQADVSLGSTFLTGSWVAGMARDNSDFDVIVAADPEKVAVLRALIAEAFRDGRLTIPKGSQTWVQLGLTGKTAEELVGDGRFAETFSIPGPERTARCSLIYMPETDTAPYFAGKPKAGALETIEGRVSDASQAHYKAARYVLNRGDGSCAEILCWHKWAGILRQGDDVRIQAVPCFDGQRSLFVQMDPNQHSIEWVDWKKNG